MGDVPVSESQCDEVWECYKQRDQHVQRLGGAAGPGLLGKPGLHVVSVQNRV